MTTPTPMRELIERATPGPWQAVSNPNCREDSATYINGASGRTIATLDSDSSVKDKANAQLIARCSPDVLALVLSALEDFTWACSKSPPIDIMRHISAANKKSVIAISALNGQPPA